MCISTSPHSVVWEALIATAWALWGWMRVSERDTERVPKKQTLGPQVVQGPPGWSRPSARRAGTSESTPCRPSGRHLARPDHKTMPQAPLIILAIALIVAVACSDGSADADGQGEGRPGQDDGVILIPPYSGPRPTTGSSTTTSARSTPEGEEIELTGTILTPTTPDCLILDSNDGRWELTGDLPEEIRPGDEIQVVGRSGPHSRGPCDAPVLEVIRISARTGGT